MEATLLQELLAVAAYRSPDATAVVHGNLSERYGVLATQVEAFASGMRSLGLERGQRVAIYLEKRIETVVAMFGSAAAGCAFVPLNPLLKPDQVAYILRDCNARVLVTSNERLATVSSSLATCPDLRHVVVINLQPTSTMEHVVPVIDWESLLASPPCRGHRAIDTDMAAILYTSGSTGSPKGVVLSHRNMVAGAKSVASYLENVRDDTLLAALPLSFDAGFSQLTTAFHAGARVVLINYLMPMDVVNAMARDRVTGFTGVPPLYIQMTQVAWPPSIASHLRYFANTGGRMPFETLQALRARLPDTKPYLMYGLTEAFRSTYLPPEEVDRRPDSIGKAIPNAEILVLKEDGARCGPGEAGELVHRGALVGMGYWNDAEKTAERYRPLPEREAGLVLPEIAVYSGDTVRLDAEGFLYFIGRNDEMIKTSGYRVSPTEVEEVLYGTQRVAEAAAFGAPHPALGQGVVVVVTGRDDATPDIPALYQACRERLPAYMVPAKIEVRAGPLPRNPNGKIDRKTLRSEFEGIFAGSK
jgi:acyl-CoA ligase (AMP-forming) (exosortase A-associated)